MLQARDPTFVTTVHDIRNHAAEDIRFGMRYRDAVTMPEISMLVFDLSGIGELVPDVDDPREQGWAEHKGELE